MVPCKLRQEAGVVPRPTISVLVPVYQGGENFRKCLQSLVETNPRPAQILVAIDGATDGSAEIADRFGVEVVRLPVRSGPAKARNTAAAMARGDILFFLDADVQVVPDIIGRVADIFAQRPDLTGVIGSYDDSPGSTNFLSQYKNLLHHYIHQTSREEASTFWSGCGAIRRETFLKVGGFDESYRWPSIEDIELGYRLTKAGFHIRLCRDLQVKHLKHWTPVSLIRTDFLQRGLPWTRLILRERRLPNDLNVRFSGRASVFLAWIMACFCVLSIIQPGWLVPLVVTGLALWILNLSLYRFFRQKRGLWFTLAAIPWHWLYFLYSGLAFAVGIFQWLLQGWVFSFYGRR